MFTSALRVSALCLAIGYLVPATDVIAQDDKAVEKKVELKVGDPAPAFEARTDADITWETAGRFGKKWVVIYFYPGDFTPGCTAQANAFRDAMHKLTEKGVEVVGVSGDSVQT
ncbi:MAG TPA: redoxin domain-containing protein, partial [Gemmata sp.]|nr:redoxin domain-containing protein [Gemmata sp.]